MAPGEVVDNVHPRDISRVEDRVLRPRVCETCAYKILKFSPCLHCIKALIILEAGTLNKKEYLHFLSQEADSTEGSCYGC